MGIEAVPLFFPHAGKNDVSRDSAQPRRPPATLEENKRLKKIMAELSLDKTRRCDGGFFVAPTTQQNLAQQ